MCRFPEGMPQKSWGTTGAHSSTRRADRNAWGFARNDNGSFEAAAVDACSKFAVDEADKFALQDAARSERNLGRAWSSGASPSRYALRALILELLFVRNTITKIARLRLLLLRTCCRAAGFDIVISAIVTYRQHSFIFATQGIGLQRNSRA